MDSSTDGASTPDDVRALALETFLGSHQETLDQLERRFRSLTVWIFSDGFVVRENAQLNVFPWKSSHLTYQRTVTKGPGGLGTVGGSESFTVRRDDGVEFQRTELDKPQLSELLTRAIEETTLALLPQARARLMQGERLQFGKIELDSRSIYVGRKAVIPLVDVTELCVFNGALKIYREGRWSAKSIGVGAITDLHVLLRIAENTPACARPLASKDVWSNRFWANNVIAEGHLSEEDFEWRDSAFLGREATLTESGSKKLRTVAQLELTDQGVEVLQTAAHARLGLSENIHYQVRKNRIVLLEADTGEPFSPVKNQWGGLFQALEALHKVPIRRFSGER